MICWCLELACGVVNAFFFDYSITDNVRRLSSLLIGGLFFLIFIESSCLHLHIQEGGPALFWL